MSGAWTALNTTAASFTATLDRTTVLVGEPVKLTLSIEGATIQGSPRMPAIAGIRILPGTTSGQNSVVGPDGKMASVQTFTFNLAATSIGKITIPSFQLAIRGQTLSTQPIQLTVLKEDPNAPPQGLAAQPAFLWAVWPKREFFINEVVTIELRLYVASSVRRIGDGQIPPLTGDGLVFGNLIQGQRYQRRVGDQIFTVVPFSLSFSPTKAGTLKIDPIQGSVILNPRNFMDNPFVRTPPPQRVPLALGAQTLTVRPLPTDNSPPGFAGAVGEFEMSVTAGPTNVTVGDPITLRLQISGRGNLSAVLLPNPLVKGDFKTYEPEVKLDTTDDHGFAGMKTVEQVVVPENTEVRELPSIEFSYFDPEAGAYRTLTHPAIPLKVMPAGSLPAPVVAADNVSNTSDAPRQDIVHIKQRLGTVQSIPGGSGFGTRFYVWAGLPMLAWLGVVTWRKRQEIIGRNPRLRRQQEVRRRIAAGLKELEQLSEQGRSEEFFSTLFRLLQEQIGLCLDQPASGITESVVDEKLAPMNVNEPTLATLHELFQSCNVARYAPEKDPQELAAMVPKLRATLAELEEVHS